MYIICNKIRAICSKIRVGMEGGPFSIGGVHIPWVESYGIWTPGSIFNGGPYSISQRQSVEIQRHSERGRLLLVALFRGRKFVNVKIPILVWGWGTLLFEI